MRKQMKVRHESVRRIASIGRGLVGSEKDDAIETIASALSERQVTADLMSASREFLSPASIISNVFIVLASAGFLLRASALVASGRGSKRDVAFSVFLIVFCLMLSAVALWAARAGSETIEAHRRKVPVSIG